MLQHSLSVLGGLNFGQFFNCIHSKIGVDIVMYDVGIIGGGPGGYVAAIRAAQLGGSVSLIEKGEWGGTCLNRGCIPTKTLFSIAHLAEQVENTPALHIPDITVDYSQALTHKAEVIQKLTGGIGQLLKANKIRTINGEATLSDKRTISVNKADGTAEQVNVKKVIIATGSEPA